MDYFNLYEFLTKWDNIISGFSDYEFEKYFDEMFQEYVVFDIKEHYGIAFSKGYPKEFRCYNKLKNAIKYILNLDILSSILLYKLKTFKFCKDIPEFRLCVDCIFKHLIYVLKMNPFNIGKNIEEIRINSSNVGYGSPNEKIKEVEQTVFINISGDICISYYFYWKNENEKTYIKNFKIDDEKVEEIFRLISLYVEDNYMSYDLDSEVGYWEMELVDSNCESYKYKDNLKCNIRGGRESLSERIREILNDDYLILFDNCEYDKINKIEINYKRVKRVDDKDSVYNEKLILDRCSNCIEHIQSGNDVNFYMKLDVSKYFDYLLEDLYSPNMLETRKDNKNIVEIPGEKRDYEVIIDFRKFPRKVIKGSYDRVGLPLDWEDFIENIKSFMRYFYNVEMFEKTVYDKPRRKYGEYIYCKVKFKNTYKYYYYITTDDAISEGDFVLVPAGNKNKVEIVKVLKIEHFKEDSVPFPLARAKHILRKCTEDDFYELGFNYEAY